MRALSSRIVLVCLSAVAAAGVACSSASETDTRSANALVINPIGTEDESDVVLQLPTDACFPGTTCAKVLGSTLPIYLDESVVSLGASTRLRVGPHLLTVGTSGYPFTTTSGQHLSFTLPVAKTVCTDASLPNVPATDFGTAISVSNAPCPTSASSVSGFGWNLYGNGCTAAYSLGPQSTYNCATAPADSFYYLNAAGVCQYGGYGTAGCTSVQSAEDALQGSALLSSSYQVYAPGTLTAQVNGAAQTITLNPGDEATFNISLPALGSVPATFATDITFDDPRANPDAKTSTITSSCSGDRSYTFPAPGTASPSSLSLNAFVNSGCTYTLNVGGRTQTLSQTATNTIALHRLDVNDVTITREDLDGGTYTVKGQWTLNYGGVQVAGPFSTSTGIDVLPGTYEFSLTYTDFDGTETQTQTLTF